MTVRYEWFDEAHTIILYDFEAGWQGDELTEAITSVDRMIRDVDYPVYTLVDTSQVNRIPPGILSSIHWGTFNAAPNWRFGVFVGAKAFLRALISTFSRLYPRFRERYVLADSLEEAVALIQERQQEDTSKLNLR
jgi:hypothetical protein